MKKIIVSFLAIVGAMAIALGGYYFWMQRPWRVVLSVNNHGLSAKELDMRAHTLVNDAKRSENLLVPKGRESEVFSHYRREAAKMWIIKEVLLSEAVAHNVTVAPNDEKEALEQLARRLKSRKLTSEQYFKEGPMSEDLKRRDFREGMLIDKYMKQEVSEKIKLDSKEIEERWNEIRRHSLLVTKPGEKPKFRTDRKAAMDMLRAEKYRKGFRILFRDAFKKSKVKSPEYPELETLNNVSPSRPEDKEGAEKAK